VGELFVEIIQYGIRAKRSLVQELAKEIFNILGE
jgi:hypothetical protein